MEHVEFLGCLLMGIGLAASCGFRVFAPLLVTGCAARYEWIPLSDSFEWLSGGPALIILATASVVEIGAYYIPWVDNMLDTVRGPGAVLAGTLLTASALGDFHPAFQWSLGLVAGGGAAAGVHGATAALRGASSLTTAGLANPVLATAENVLSFLISIVSLLVPLIAAITLLILAFVAWRLLRRIWRRRRRRRGEGSSGSEGEPVRI